MKLVPLRNNVVVRRQEADKATKGGILLPDTAVKKVNRGEVLAVGPGRVNEEGKTIPMVVQVGQVVAFGEWTGSEFDLDGDKVVIVSEDQLLGILDVVLHADRRPD
jgi:chaperonin GroES